MKKQAAQPLTQEPKKAAAKAVEAQERSVKPDKSGISEDDYDDSEDFDIEIVDLDDLDL